MRENGNKYRSDIGVAPAEHRALNSVHVLKLDWKLTPPLLLPLLMRTDEPECQCEWKKGVIGGMEKGDGGISAVCPARLISYPPECNAGSQGKRGRGGFLP